MNFYLVLGVVVVVVFFWLSSTGRINARATAAPPIPQVDWSQLSTPRDGVTVAEPDGDCRPQWNNDSIMLEVPDGVHELQGNGQQNAPRVLRKVSGDFAIEVEVAGEWNPRTGGKFPFAPYHGAGILVWIG